MLRLGKLTDYAILILSQLSQQAEQILSATALSELLHIPLPTVSKVLKMLADADLVNAIRGAEGGYHLACPANKINLLMVIAAMEGDLALTECCEGVSACSIEAYCHLRGNWRKINGMVEEILKRFTILDMTAERGRY